MKDLLRALMNAEIRGNLPSQYFANFVRGFSWPSQRAHIILDGHRVGGLINILSKAKDKNLIGTKTLGSLCKEMVLNTSMQTANFDRMLWVPGKLLTHKSIGIDETVVLECVGTFVNGLQGRKAYLTTFLGFKNNIYKAAQENEFGFGKKTAKLAVKALFPSLKETITFLEKDDQNKRQKTGRSTVSSRTT
ncbi:uncharacterized protein BDZ99DRAFT_483833 [Mytilinidion resinicola]|uniref:Uncharacterized protein n=1 Tax=Mytilinidion resinicola TaxID=574789 RepID=A0A6A6XXR3_9PEZI|nr:uncharacterized protein BDZ99DRAFT_483833 [Mytilinidion resinicola]KAF2801341.1 hypothetical protein BDZ99DRAFT_483833 [Mytilinidion resinicola]